VGPPPRCKTYLPQKCYNENVSYPSSLLFVSFLRVCFREDKSSLRMDGNDTLIRLANPVTKYRSFIWVVAHVFVVVVKKCGRANDLNYLFKNVYVG